MALAVKFCGNFIKNAISTITPKYVATNILNRNFHQLMVAPHLSLLNSSTMTSTMPASSSSLSVVGLQRLLSPFNSLITQVAGFKVKGRLRRRCKDCYFVIRNRRHYVICPTHPRHKQMSMKKRDYKTWILTHATQSKVRPF